MDIDNGESSSAPPPQQGAPYPGCASGDRGPGPLAGGPDARGVPFGRPVPPQRPPEATFAARFFSLLLVISIGLGFWLVFQGPPAPAARKPEKAGSEMSWLSTEGIALVKVYGVIELRDDKYGLGRSPGADGVVQQLKKFRKDPKVKGLVLRVNSPGGTVAASQEIHHQVRELAKKIPVVVSMGDVAASGGYYISAPATYIFANAGTITGSIGVITEVANYEKLLSVVGLKLTTFTSGPHKDMGSGHRPITPGESKIFQSIINDAYRQFVDAVTDGRVIDPKKREAGKTPSGRVAVLKNRDDVREHADGRVYTGAQAKDIGLVDELGDLDDAVRKAGMLAGLGEDPKIIKGSTPTFEELMGSLVSDGVRSDLTSQLDTVLSPRPPLMYLYRPGL